MACMTPADGRHAHLHRRPRGRGIPRQRHRMADGQPPPRLPGLRRGRRVPPAGHDGDDRPRLPPLPLPQAHLPQPGPRAVHQPRDEPLHPVLPLRALLPRLRRRATTWTSSASRNQRLLRPRTRTACWRASSAATWWRSAPPACSPTRPSSSHYTRKWDLQTAPSVCVHCGLGCNTIPGERYGTLRRVLNRYNGEVNGYFLCDRGRFGYEFVNSRSRIRAGRCCATAPASEPSLDAPRHAIRQRLAARARGRVIGIGSPRASLEANFALRELVGAGALLRRHVRTRSSAWSTWPSTILREGPGRARPRSREIEPADAVLVLGEDVTNTRPACWRWPAPVASAAADSASRPALKHPRLERRRGARGGPGAQRAALHRHRRRDTARRRRRRQTYRAAPDDIARLGFAVAHAARPSARRRCPDLPRRRWPSCAERSPQRSAQARSARSSSRARAAAATAILQAAANVAWALRARGAAARALLRAARVQQPGAGHAGRRHASRRRFERRVDGSADTVIILENDLYRRVPPSGRATRSSTRCRARGRARLTWTTATTAKRGAGAARRDLRRGRRHAGQQRGPRAALLPGLRARRARFSESWRWLRDIAPRRRPRPAAGLADARRGARRAWPPVCRSCAGVRKPRPPADFRIAGQKIPREPHRYSGRTAMHADIDVTSPSRPTIPTRRWRSPWRAIRDSRPPSLIPCFWAPGWNSIQAMNKFQEEIGGAVARRRPRACG